MRTMTGCRRNVSAYGDLCMPWREMACLEDGLLAVKAGESIASWTPRLTLQGPCLMEAVLAGGTWNLGA